MILFLLLFALGSGNPSRNEIDYQTAHWYRRLKAVKVSDKITVDGMLNEEAWAGAPVAGDFIQSEPLEGEPSAERTEVRVLYDRENLYFGLYAHDSHVGHVVVSELKKDFTSEATDA